MSWSRSLWFLGFIALISLLAGAMGLMILGRAGDALARGVSAYERGEWRQAIEQARLRLQA